MPHQNPNIQNLGTVNIEYIASNVRMLRHLDNKWHEKVLQLVISGYSELQLTGNIQKIKTVALTVDSANIAYFPNDYVEYVRIGVVIEGRLQELVQNNNIALGADVSCGENIRPTITRTNEDFADGIGGERETWLTKDYTIGGAFSPAYYRIEEENRRVVFLQHKFTNFQVIMEYKCLDITDEAIIPRKAVPAITAYVEWQLDRRDRNVHNYDKNISKNEWLAERNKLYAMNTAFTKEEWQDNERKHTHRGLK